jgi:hypothetical protein
MQEEHLEDAWAVGKAEVKVSEVVGDKPSCPSAKEATESVHGLGW